VNIDIIIANVYFIINICKQVDVVPLKTIVTLLRALQLGSYILASPFFQVRLSQMNAYCATDFLVSIKENSMLSV